MDTVEDNIFFNRLGLPNADHTNWREKAAELIGDDEVEYKGYRVKAGKYPIITLMSSDETALSSVYDRAIALSDAE